LYLCNVLLLWYGWPDCTLELIAGIVGSKKRVPRKMLEIVKIQRKTDEKADVKWPAIRRSEVC
jgi:hypothetical protein